MWRIFIVRHRCCALAPSGQATAPPPSSVMTSRRPIIRSPLVGAGNERRWRAPGGREINDHFEFCRLRDRQVGRFLAFDDAARIDADRAIAFLWPRSTDVNARIVGEYMARTLGQLFIIENVQGAGGTTGSTRAMRVKADGYTSLMGHMCTHAVSVSLYPNLAYKPDVDFEPIGVVMRSRPSSWRSYEFMAG